MPLYDLQDEETGEVVEVYFPMAEAPEIGSKVMVSGRELLRIPSVQYQSQAKATFYLPGAPSLARAQWDGHQWIAPADEPWHPPKQKYDQKGRPVFENVKQREEFLAHSEGTYAFGTD